MAHDHHDHDHAQPHDHAHPHPPREDDDVALTYGEAKFLALKSLLIEKGLVTADEIRRRHEYNDSKTPHQGARMVAKAWPWSIRFGSGMAIKPRNRSFGCVQISSARVSTSATAHPDLPASSSTFT